jgi:hypothetical protein
VKRTTIGLEAVRSRKDLWVNFNRDSSGELKEPLCLEGKIRTILKDLEVSAEAFAEAKGVHALGLVSEPRKDSFLSVVRKRKISPCRLEEEMCKHPIR